MSFDSSKSIDSLKENKSESKTQSPDNWLFIAAAVFGLATFAKIPNAILFLPLLGWELYNKRFKNLILCMSFFVIPLIILFGYFSLTTGTLTPYGGDRMVYVHKYPFMDDYGPNNEIGTEVFLSKPHNILSRINTISTTALFYDMFYYLFGRFTGLTWYYMPAIIALYLMLSSKIKNSNSRMKSIFNLEYLNIKHVLILSAIILNALFYIVIHPYNYFGGAHAIGNRYFYIFPAFLFLVDEIKFDKKLIAFFIIAILFTAPINVNPVGNSNNPCMHTVKLPYSALPVEYTLLYNLPFWGYSNTIGDITYYYLNNNTFPPNENIFYIKGSAKAELFMRSAQPLPRYKVDIFSFAKNNKITMDIGGDRKQIKLNKFESCTLIFIPKPTYECKKLYAYKISIETTSGDIIFSKYVGLYFKPSDERDIFSTQNKLSKMFVIVGKGWHGFESWQDTPTRWASNNATIFIYSTENKDSDIFFNVVSFYKPRNLLVYLNDELIHEQKFPTGFVEVEIPVKLKEGENILRFYTPDGCQSPVDISELKSKDSRCLSLAFQNIIIMEVI